MTTKSKHIAKTYLTEELVLNNISICKEFIIEITEDCNLACSYCRNGVLYKNKKDSNLQEISIENINALLDYIYISCNKINNSSLNKEITFGFYGGEPLLKIDLIKEIVNLIEAKFPFAKYTMTTNGIFLQREIDYLIEKKFKISVSLDGDNYSNSYRVSKNGKTTFKIVFEALKYIQKKHPDFFLKTT